MTSPEYEYTKHHMSNEVRNILAVWMGGKTLQTIVEIPQNITEDAIKVAKDWHRILTTPEMGEHGLHDLGWFMLEAYDIAPTNEKFQQQELEYSEAS